MFCNAYVAFSFAIPHARSRVEAVLYFGAMYNRLNFRSLDQTACLVSRSVPCTLYVRMYVLATPTQHSVQEI